MGSISQELVDRICSFLDRESLKSTLLVSRGFQDAAERYSEEFQHYNLTESNDDKFLSLYNARRFRFLRYVHCAPTLAPLEPDEGDLEVPCRENALQLQTWDQEFSRQIHHLFATIATLEKQVGVEDTTRNIHLCISAPTRKLNLRGNCLHHGFVSWRIHLLSHETLPRLKCVRNLTIRNPDIYFSADYANPSIRKLDLRILLDIAARLPNVETLQCFVGGDEWYNSYSNASRRHITRDAAGPRRDSRHDFAKALQSLGALPSSLRYVELDFLYPLDAVDQIDQRRRLPNLVKPSTYDPFSNSLRLLSYHLRSIKLRVIADPTLFWPMDTNANTITPFWPNLESLHVVFHMSAPSGSWYFRGLPGIGAESGFPVTERSYPPLSPDEDTMEDDKVDDDTAYGAEYGPPDRDIDVVQFRVEPNDELLGPFLTAFAKAAAAMPSLADAALWCPLSFNVELIQDQYESFDETQVSKFLGDNLSWGIAYTKPGVKAFNPLCGVDHSPNRQIWWSVGQWRPEPELHRLFQQIGKQHGESLDEYWNSEYAGEGLDNREMFEEHAYFNEPPYAPCSS